MLDFPASGQSGTKMNKNPMPDSALYRNDLVPNRDTRCRNAETGRIDLDADA
jgi:hypothetical protein